MSNLKNLVAKANSGLSLRSTPKERFGLNGFLAASTDQMLMTRGGYGASFYNGPSGWSSGGGSGPGGSRDSIGYPAANGNLNAAVKAGVSAVTSPGGIFSGVYIGLIRRTPVGVAGTFIAGYVNNVYSQYTSYIARVKKASSGRK